MTGRLLIAGAASLWGMWSLCFRNAERLAARPGELGGELGGKLSATVESFVVMAVMLMAIAPLALPSRSSRRATAAGPREAKHWLLVFALGVTDGLNVLCFFTALQTTTVAIAVLTHYLAPLLVALFAPAVLGEPWRKRTFVALGIALAGLVLLLDPMSSPTESSSRALTGAGYGTLSAVFYAANVFLGKGLGGRFTPMELSAWPKISSLLVLGAALILGGNGSDALAVAPGPLLVLVVGGLLFGALPLVMFYRGLASTPASQASVLTFCEPLVAVLVGATVWGEVLGPLALGGGMLVLAAAAVISIPSRPAQRADLPGST